MRLTAARAGVFYAVCAYRDSGMQVCVRFITAAFMPGPGDAAAARGTEPRESDSLRTVYTSTARVPRQQRRCLSTHNAALRDTEHASQDGTT